MRYLNQKLYDLSYTISIIKTITKDENSPFEMMSQAPFLVKLLSKGQYCVYKKSIYVPEFHLELSMSKCDDDRELATAKLLPCIMLLHDYKEVSFFRMLRFLYTLKYQLHYFLYEFLFLKATKHVFYATIAMGFMSSRRYFGKRLHPDIVEEYLRTILIANSTKKQI